MKIAIALLAAFLLSGCAQWNKLSNEEKGAVIIGTTVVVGAMIIKNSQPTHIHNCISTRSLETGCPR